MYSQVAFMSLQGGGKSSTGEELSKVSNLDFADLDLKVLMKSGYSNIQKLVAELGEDAFRDFEYSACAEIPSSRVPVWALGGGTPEFERNRLILERDTIFKIFLDILPENQLNRLENDTIGNANRIQTSREETEDKLAGLQKTYERRVLSGLYPNFANKVIDVNEMSLQEVVDEVRGLPELQELLQKAA